MVIVGLVMLAVGAVLLTRSDADADEVEAFLEGSVPVTGDEPDLLPDSDNRGL